MKCPKCKAELKTCTVDGKTELFCWTCQKVISFTAIAAEGISPREALSPRQGHRGVTEAHCEPAPSAGEEEFANYWTTRFPLLPFKPEYPFYPFRGWRVDFAWPEAKVAVEYEGGGAYGHGRANRYAGDIDKYNALACGGWALLRLTPSMMKSEAKREEFVRLLRTLLYNRLPSKEEKERS